MLRKQISKEQIDVLAEVVRTYVDPDVLERGLEYQQKGLVYNAAVQSSAYTAKVQGMRVFDVTINLDFLSASRCSCEAKPYCEHQAAAFFYAYAVYGRPDHFLRQIKPDVETAGNRIDQSSLHRITTMLTGSAEPPSGVPVRDKDGPQDWSRYIRDTYRSFAKKHALHKAHPNDFLTAYLQLVQKPTSWWRTPARQLFQLFASLYALRQTDALYDEQASSAPSRMAAFEKAVKTSMDKMQQAAKEIAAETIPEPLLPHLQALADQIRETLADHADGMVDGLYVYRFLWSRLLQHHGMIDGEAARLEREIAQLEKAAAGAPGDTKPADRLRVALAHFDVIRKADDRATERLDELSRVTPADFLGYLHTFSQGEHTERLLHWLRWLAPAFREGRADAAELNLYCDYWIAAYKQGASDEEVRRTLAAFLPGSYPKYTGFLMQTGRMREWVEFHLAYGISPLTMSPLDLKRVEEQDPGLLLPLYHQAVERTIMAKSRDAYKQAAYLLRKLRGYYEACGSLARFHEFVDRLSMRYARLRAFQEELRRGKLLT